jgi:CRP/FNR family transcriptional regulator
LIWIKRRRIGIKLAASLTGLMTIFQRFDHVPNFAYHLAGHEEFQLMDLAAARRSVSINVAPGPASPHCNECGSRHVGICDALSDEELQFLSKVAQRVTVAPAKIFIEESEPATFFYNINAGYVRMFKSLPDGRRNITGFMGVGQFLGLGAGGNFAFSAEAIGEVKLCRFNRKALATVFTDFPALERRPLGIATHELTIAHDQMLLLGRKTAQERVASFIIAWAERSDLCPAGGMPKPGQSLALPMTRTDLADHLGLTIETVSRALNLMKKQGLIALGNIHQITLLNPRRLAEIAAGDA